MLKHYKRLFYILGVICCLNMYSFVASAQGNYDKEEYFSVCKEIATPINLFSALKIQISPTNGYWTDKQGNLVSNIFDPTGQTKGEHEFIFNVTANAYCGAIAGDKYLVTIDLSENLLDLDRSFTDPRCGTPNGSITIDTVRNGSGNYSYMLAMLNGTTGKKDTIQTWTPFDVTNTSTTLPHVPHVVNSALAAGEYYLYILDRDKGISCSPLLIDTITLTMQSSGLLVYTTDIISPTGSGQGTRAVDNIQGGVSPYTYDWYLYDKSTGSYGTTPIYSGGDTYAGTTLGNKYKVVVTDSYGCTGEEEFEFDGDIVNILHNLYFCQGSFVELYSGVTVQPVTYESLFFLTSPDKGKDWTGYSIKVYNDATTTTAEDITWFIDAVTNGVHTSDSTVTKYIEITTPSGVNPREQISVRIFNRPADLGIRVLNNKTEWDIADKVRVEVTPDNMSWYDYFLNNTLVGDSIDYYIFEVDAMRFTGTVQDKLRADLYEMVRIPNSPADSVCTWSVTEPVIINVPFPNTFTPDGDGINDVFLGGDKFGNREFHLDIINRYGHSLYSGDKGWDGTYKGSPVTPGTYYYIVKVKVADGTVKTIEGSVTLIRKQR